MLSQFKQYLFSELKIVLPSLYCILSIKIGLTSFPPFKNEQYAVVNFNKVVSADPSDIESSSLGLSYIFSYIVKLFIFFKPSS